MVGCHMLPHSLCKAPSLRGFCPHMGIYEIDVARITILVEPRSRSVPVCAAVSLAGGTFDGACEISVLPFRLHAFTCYDFITQLLLVHCHQLWDVLHILALWRMPTVGHLS